MGCFFNLFPLQKNSLKKKKQDLKLLQDGAGRIYFQKKNSEGIKSFLEILLHCPHESNIVLGNMNIF